MSRRRGTDEDPASLFFEAETFEEIAQQYDSTQRNMISTPGHVQAIVFSDALLSDRGRMEELLKVPGTGPCAWAQCLSVSRRKPEDIMEQNGKQVESVGEYLCGIYDNRVKERGGDTGGLVLCVGKRKEHSVDSGKRRKRFKVYGISERIVSVCV